MTQSDISTAAVQMAPGLFSLGGMLEASRLRTWIPDYVEGFIPCQCYALRDGDQLLLLDGGLPILADTIHAGLRPLVQGTRTRRFCMTRRELDTILNLPRIVHEFDITSIHCGGDLSPIDFFEAIEDGIDEASAAAQIASLADAPFSFLRPGDVMEVGRFRLEMLKASVMVLPTFWFYESTTRTLFCSDSWGLGAQPDERGARVLAGAGSAITASAIRDFLAVKFEWLEGIDNSPIARDLKALLADRPVDRICPNFGCVIEGPEIGATLAERTAQALAEMAAMPWRSALEGWRSSGTSGRPAAAL